MADNISVLDSNATARTVKTTDTSDVHTPHHNVDSITAGSVDIAGALPIGDNNIGNVDVASMPSDTFVADEGALGKGVLLQGDDGTDRHNVAVDTSGYLQIDVVSGSVDITAGSVELTGALPAGTNTLGTVTANAGTGTFGISGTVTANAGTGALGAKLQDGGGTALTSTTVSADRALDVNVVQSSTVAVTGTVTANAGTGTFATAGTISSGSIDIKGALPAGDNNIGNVDITSGSIEITSASLCINEALPAGDNNIGNVDIVTGPTGANSLQVQGSTASGLAATGYPVRVAGQDSGSTVRALLADSAGHLQTDVVSGSVSVDDGGNTLTVDGTVTANAGTGTFGVSGTVTANAGTGTFATAGTISSGSIDIKGALPAGNNNIGNVDIVTGPTGANALQVQGTAASGVVATGNPVRIAGQSAGSTVYALLADSAGHLQTDILSVVPGTGATNLGKAEDAAHASSDVGVMALAVRVDDAQSLSNASGDYTPLAVNEDGLLRTNTQQHYHIDECSASTGWSALNNDTTGLRTTACHVCGTRALEFDKVNGTDDTVFGCIQKTITSFNITAYAKGGGFFIWNLYVSALANVNYAFIRAGTDSSNYNEWRVDADALRADWNNIRAPLWAPTQAGQVGDGWDPTAITYIAAGVALDNHINTLSNIRLDHIATNSGLQTSADITSQVSSEISSPNVNVKKWGAYSVTTDQGNAGTGVLRVAIADDDTNLATINTSASLLTDAIAAEGGALGKGILVQGDDGTDRTNVLVDTSGHFQVDVVTGSTSIDDGGNTITVDGAVTVSGSVEVTGALPAGTNTLGSVTVTSGSIDIKGALPIGDNNIGNVDVLSITAGSVDVAGALPAGTNNIGDVDIASGSVDVITPTAACAIHIQGTTAHDAAASGNLVQIGGVAETTYISSAVSDGDAVRAWFDDLGRQVVQVGVGYKDYYATSYTSEQTNAALIAGSTNLVLCLYDILVSTAASGTVLLEESDGTTRVFGPLTLAANGGWQFNSAAGLELTSGCGLVATTACQGSSAVSITINYGVISG